MTASRLVKVLALLLLAGAVASAVVVGIRSVSYTLRVAVPPVSKEQQKAFAELSREVAGTSRWLSVVRVPVADAAAAAKALQDGAADIAVLRTDVALPPKAQTVAILRRDTVFLIVPAQSPVESFRDLKGLAVGLLPGPQADDALLAAILGYYDVPNGSVQRVALNPQDVGNAVRQKKVAAVFVVGQPGTGPAAEAFAAMAKATRATPDIVGVGEAEALVRRVATLETAEIPQGVFGGASPRPEEAVPTVATAWRLAASKDLSALVVGELTQRLFAAKARLLAANPVLADVEAPDTETTTFAIHPGAKAYVDGEQPSVFDRFESLFWIGSALLGVLGSGVTWVVAKVRGRKEGVGEMDRLIGFLRDVRTADTARLDVLQQELDAVVQRLLAARQEGALDDADMNTYQMAIGYARQAVEDRRSALGGRVAA